MAFRPLARSGLGHAKCFACALVNRRRALKRLLALGAGPVALAAI
jgi:hypothetical protein